MPSPDPAAFEYRPEVTLAEETDRDWMEHLGYSWRDEADNSWLQDLNSRIALGSLRLGVVSAPEARETTQEVRETFVRSLPALSPKAIDTAVGNHKLPPTDTFIRLQRLLYARGIDSVAMVDKTANSLAINPDYLERKLTIMYAAARAWKWPDRKDTVHRIVEFYPKVASVSESRLRTLVRLATYALEPVAVPDEQTFASIVTVTGKSLEGFIVAYLQKGPGQRWGAADLSVAAYQHVGTDRAALRAFIARYPDDPVAKAFLRSR